AGGVPGVVHGDPDRPAARQGMPGPDPELVVVGAAERRPTGGQVHRRHGQEEVEVERAQAYGRAQGEPRPSGESPGEAVAVVDLVGPDVDAAVAVLGAV